MVKQSSTLYMLYFQNLCQNEESDYLRRRRIRVFDVESLTVTAAVHVYVSTPLPGGDDNGIERRH